MKIILFVSLVAATFSSLASAQNVRQPFWERMQWNNIVELYPNSYVLNTINTPNRVLRPQYGEYLKVEVSNCGDVNYSGVAAFDIDRFNRVLPLNIVREKSDYEREYQVHYYSIKGGAFFAARG
jgi:hypothetical protein